MGITVATPSLSHNSFYHSRNKPAMSTFKDPTVVPFSYQKHGVATGDSPSKSTLTAIRKSVSIPSLSSLIWGSITRVGDTLTHIGTGLGKEEREAARWITQRKLLLSLRLSSVSLDTATTYLRRYMTGSLGVLTDV